MGVPGTLSLKTRYKCFLTNRVARGVRFSLDFRVYPFLVGKWPGIPVFGYCPWLNPPLQIELSPEGVCICPGITRTRNFRKFCRAFIPVPGTPGSFVRPCHNTRNFWKFCKTSIPVPELMLVLYGIHTRTRNFCDFCTPRGTIPRV